MFELTEMTYETCAKCLWQVVEFYPEVEQTPVCDYCVECDE